MTLGGLTAAIGTKDPAQMAQANDNLTRALVPMLRDVDVAIAGGGDELLANEGDLLVPGDAVSVDPVTGLPLPYPLVATDRTGAAVPIVTTAGDYKYVGRLVVDFDSSGRVLATGAGSGPVRVSGVAPDAVEALIGEIRGVVEVAGPLSFGAVGVFAEILDPLVGAGISVLGFSTFDTDWILVPAESALAAADAWRRAGLVLTPSSLSGGAG